MTMKVFSKAYDGEDLADLSRDVAESLDSRFNPAMSEVEVDEYGFHRGLIKVDIRWIDKKYTTRACKSNIIIAKKLILEGASKSEVQKVTNIGDTTYYRLRLQLGVSQGDGRVRNPEKEDMVVNLLTNTSHSMEKIAQTAKVQKQFVVDTNKKYCIRPMRKARRSPKETKED